MNQNADRLSFQMKTSGVHHDVLKMVLSLLLKKNIISADQCKEIADMLEKNLEDLKTLTDKLCIE